MRHPADERLWIGFWRASHGKSRAIDEFERASSELGKSFPAARLGPILILIEEGRLDDARTKVALLAGPSASPEVLLTYLLLQLATERPREVIEGTLQQLHDADLLLFNAVNGVLIEEGALYNADAPKVVNKIANSDCGSVVPTVVRDGCIQQHKNLHGDADTIAWQARMESSIEEKRVQEALAEARKHFAEVDTNIAAVLTALRVQQEREETKDAVLRKRMEGVEEKQRAQAKILHSHTESLKLNEKQWIAVVRLFKETQEELGKKTAALEQSIAERDKRIMDLISPLSERVKLVARMELSKEKADRIIDDLDSQQPSRIVRAATEALKAISIAPHLGPLHFDILGIIKALLELTQ